MRTTECAAVYDVRSRFGAVGHAADVPKLSALADGAKLLLSLRFQANTGVQRPFLYSVPNRARFFFYRYVKSTLIIKKKELWPYLSLKF